jgi:hypothetical protein
VIKRRQFISTLAGASLAAVIPKVAAASAVFDIDAPTDGRDATDIIRAQLADIPDGDPGTPTIVRFPVGNSSGGYRVDGGLVLRDRRHLVITGPSGDNRARLYTPTVGRELGIVDRNGNSLRSHVLVGASHDIVLTHLSIRGPNSGRDEGDAAYVSNLVFEHAFCITGGSSHITVDRCDSKDVHGDGAYVGGGTSHVGLTNVEMEFCGRQGIAITNAHIVLIDHCRVARVRRSGIDFEPNGASWIVRDVEVRNCSIDARLVAFAAHGQSEVSSIWIHHNTIARSAGSWPMISVKQGDGGRRTDWRFEHNIRSNPTNPYHQVSFTRVDGLSVVGNIAWAKSKNAKAIAGVRLETCGGEIEVVGNDFSYCPELLDATPPAPNVVHCDNLWGDGVSDGLCTSDEEVTPPSTEDSTTTITSHPPNSDPPDTPTTSVTSTTTPPGKSSSGTSVPASTTIGSGEASTTTQAAVADSHSDGGSGNMNAGPMLRGENLRAQLATDVGPRAAHMRRHHSRPKRLPADFADTPGQGGLVSAAALGAIGWLIQRERSHRASSPD